MFSKLFQTISKLFQMNNWPLREKFITHFLLISIVPSLLITIFISWTVSNIIERQSNTHLMQLIGNVSKSLDVQAGSIQNISYFISMNQDVQYFLDGGSDMLQQDQDRYRLHSFLQGFSTLYSEIAGIIVVRYDGQYLSNDMYARSEQNLTEEYWYHEAMAAHGIYKMIGHPENRNVTTHVNYKDSEIVSVVRAIQDPETGKTKGVVLIDLKLRVIAEMLRDVKLGKSGYLLVVDEKGDAIYEPPHAYNFIPSDHEQWKKQTSGSFNIEVNKEDHHILYYTSTFTNWTTVGVFPLQDTLQAIKDTNKYLVFFFFLLCVIGMTASIFLSTSITKPITKLASMMRKVEEGNMNIPLLADRKDEVGVLVNSFQKMIVQIKRLLKQVEEEQYKKREAELRSLQAHIQPHFLYNTLDTIQWLTRKEGAHEATEMVGALSKLFRIGLSKGNEIIPLVDEIEHVKSYLIIQKTRYKEKLNYTIDVDEDCNRLYVMKIILQPIVENAIYHGIKERRGTGTVSIKISQSHGFLKMIIEDDGKGMDGERLLSLRKALSSPLVDQEHVIATPTLSRGGELVGYGLRNVQERIQLSFGALYGITIESALHDGTVVTITHPILTQKGSEHIDEKVKSYSSR